MFLALALGLALGQSAQAQVLISEYNFAGQPGTETSVAPLNLQPTIATAGNLIDGPGLQPQALANSINASNWTTSNTAPPISATNYYSFTLPPTTGSTEIDSILFNVVRSTTGPTTAILRASTDGFTTATDLATFGITTTPSVQNGITSPFTISGPTEFRLYGYDAKNNGLNAQFGLIFTDPTASPGVQILGKAVPEPSTMLLTGLGLFGTGAFYARRKRKETPAEEEKA